MATDIHNDFLITLNDILKNDFNLNELRQLCFRLGIDYEDLVGTTKSDKCQSLIEYMKRRRLLSDLISAGRQLRPNTEWPDIGEYFSESSMGEKTISNGTPYYAIVTLVVSLIIAILWWVQDCGYEPLLAIIAGIAALVSVVSIAMKPTLSRSVDIILSLIISAIAVFGIVVMLAGACCRSPRITNIVANPTTVKSGQTSTITVFVTDENRDPLSYEWSTDYGTVLSGNQGPTTEYTAPLHPETGHDTIRVIVDDGAGCRVEESIRIAIQN